MSDMNSVAARADALRLKTIRILEELMEKGSEFELPQPLEPLEPLNAYRQKLVDNTFKILVIGEAKRGKSTFVNALMGRDLLPTDPDVATSQVFCVRRAQHEAYRLRFEDDSDLPISINDLARYGSQVVADSEDIEEVLELNKIIRWIEIEGPFKFIPDGVHILDTPGLGSLYGDHALITRRFVPLADAVIFVLDSTQLAGGPDLEFLKQILEVTSNIFFIQTKIDKLTPDKWKEALERHQALLKEHFHDRPIDTRVWPIASPLLRKSTKENDPYDIVSHHRELAVALQRFLFRVSGWSRSADALMTAGSYHDTLHKLLSNRHSFLLASSQKQKEIEQQIRRLKQKFEAEWGVNGGKRRELLVQGQQIFDLGKKAFDQALRPHGAIETALEERIDTIRSVKEAQAMAKTLKYAIAEEVEKQWQQMRKEVKSQCTDLLSRFIQAVNAVTVFDTIDQQVIVLPEKADTQVTPVEITASDDLWTRLSGARKEMWLVTIVRFLVPTIPVIGEAIVFPVVLLVVAKGWRQEKISQLESGRQQLKQHVSKLMHKVRRYFSEVDLAAKRSSRVDEYFKALMRTLTEQVEQVAQQKLKEVEAEVSKLTHAMNLDDEQRRINRQQVQGQLVTWNAIGITIKEATMELNQLKQAS